MACLILLALVTIPARAQQPAPERVIDVTGSVEGAIDREGGRFLRDYEETSRFLVRADELRRLNPRRQLLLVRPYQPVLADKIIYFKDSCFASRYDANPYITPRPALG